MQNEYPDEETFQIIYEEVLDQFKGILDRINSQREVRSNNCFYRGYLNIELLGI
jgi:hypothetical protein